MSWLKTFLIKSKWSIYYWLARQKYHSKKKALFPKNVGVMVFGPEKNLVDINLINEISQELTSRLDDPSQVITNPKSIVTKLRQVETLPGLKKLYQQIVPFVEREIYGSHVDVAPYGWRTPMQKQTWQWHHDQALDTVMKVMIYMNDVGEGQAPFEYLRHQETSQPIRISMTYPPRYPDGRISPAVLAEYRQKGYEPHKVTGPKGTLVFFDNNIIHNKNLPTTGHRDVLVLEMNTSLKSSI